MLQFPIKIQIYISTWFFFVASLSIIYLLPAFIRYGVTYTHLVNVYIPFIKDLSHSISPTLGGSSFPLLTAFHLFILQYYVTIFTELVQLSANGKFNFIMSFFVSMSCAQQYLHYTLIFCFR